MFPRNLCCWICNYVQNIRLFVDMNQETRAHYFIMSRSNVAPMLRPFQLFWFKQALRPRKFVCNALNTHSTIQLRPLTLDIAMQKIQIFALH